MKIQKVALILTAAITLSGCNGTNYGIPEEKWSTMSHSQRQAAADLYELDQHRVEELRKLNAMKAEKANNDLRRQREANDEQVQVDQQQRNVNNLHTKEVHKQKQRERDLDALKQTSVNPL